MSSRVSPTWIRRVTCGCGSHAQAGDWEAARKEQERLCRLFEMVWVSLPRTSAGSAGVGAFKTAMRALGIIATNTMARPQRSLNA